MSKQFAKFAAGFALIFSAVVAAPAFSAGKHDGQANCPYARTKTVQAKPVVPAPQPRSLTIVEHRKRDVQILSFGP